MIVHRLSALVGAIAVLLTMSLPASAAPKVPTAQDFGRASAISDVSVSGDGKHIAALTSADGETVNISVWRTDSPGERPAIFGASHLRILAVRFLKNDRLIVTTVQLLTVGIEKKHLIKQYVTDLEGKTWTTLLPESRAGQSSEEQVHDRQADAEVISSLPLDPQYVLVEDNRLESYGDIYRVNVYTGAAERTDRGSERFFDYRADLTGAVRAKTELNFDQGKVYLAEWIKDPDTGKWEEHFRSYAKDRRITAVIGFSTDPHVVYVSTTQPNDDKASLYEYDTRQRKLLEPLFAHKLFDADGYVWSRAKADYGRPLGFTYEAEDQKTYWVDDRLVAIAAGLDKALAPGHTDMDWVDPGTGAAARIAVTTDADVNIVSMSDDLKYVIVHKGGPKNPGEYYLLTDGAKLALLGRGAPWIDTAALGDTRLVEYPARDGLMIPGFLTTPDKALFGPGPYPTLIEPHGGPWARDEQEWNVGGWTQYFAARGFAVLEPQFRGSQGWGDKLWRAGDGEWGQKMQDDKDDGVKWLIAQGVADSKRVAMFGYSYGGYAALAASERPNGLYQCAISGAGAGDLAAIERATFDDRFQREFQHPTIKGLDALEHAKEAKIPVFLYHGDRDQTVQIEQSRKFAAALKAAGKPYRLLEIPDMGHQYIYMTPAMLALQLTAIDDFLKTGCKPGGL